MKILQTQGVHHITLIGADRQTSIDFWEGVLGMPFIFEQPNLDVPEESHLYFDPGDGVLITVFTREDRKVDSTRNPEGIGNLHHIAFVVSRATYTQARTRLEERGIKHSGEVDRGFMDSIYFRDPLGQLLELACYKFVPPVGVTAAEVLLEAHRIRVAEGAYNISDSHLADAIALLAKRTRQSLSDDRSAKHAYTRSHNTLWD
jgi:catechol 2,3-dioxygenase-like lactoylglutathione lyase family enzyme